MGGFLDAIKNTGLPPLVERWFGTVAERVSKLADRVRALDEAEVAVATSNFAMTAENVVSYVGAGGDTITLFPAAAITGRRTRFRAVMNNGTGSVTLAASGADTINGAASLSLRQGESAVILSDGASNLRTLGTLLNGTFQPLTSTTFADLTLASSTVKIVWNIGARLLANANLSLVVDTIWRLAYAINAQGHTLTSSEIRGFRIQPTVTDAGGATHKPFSISDDDGLNPDLLAIVAGSTRQLQTRLASILINNTSGLQIGTAASQKLGFLGATPVARQATPTTLADVIAILQAFGFSS